MDETIDLRIEIAAQWLYDGNGHAISWSAANATDPRLVAHYRSRAAGLIAAIDVTLRPPHAIAATSVPPVNNP